MTDLTNGVSSWSPLANDRVGDCVVAALGHLMQVRALHARGASFTITDAQILKAYGDITGWPASDPGMLIEDGINYVLNVGIAGHQLWGKSDWFWVPSLFTRRSPADLRSYIAWFGGVVIGLTLPDAAVQYGRPWSGWMGPPNPNKGHCVPLVSYDANWIECITWGAVVRVDWEFLKNYCDELWFVTGADWFTTKNVTADFGITDPEIFENIKWHARDGWDIAV